MKNLINKKNSDKILFTPGPASLSEANLINLNPSFGRGDEQYLKTEKNVFEHKKDRNKKIIQFTDKKYKIIATDEILIETCQL